MTNLVSPAGLPNTNSMADVIDSLKRLERIGSENSKTTEKLIAAANELEKLIVSQFAAFGSTEVYFTKTENDHPNSRIVFQYRTFQGTRLLDKDSRYAAGDRASSLRFSEAIANGLLDVVSEKLLELQREATTALEIMEEALAGFTVGQKAEATVKARELFKELTTRMAAERKAEESAIREREEAMRHVMKLKLAAENADKLKKPSK